MGNGGSNRNVSMHMEGQGSSYSLLDEEKYKYFFILAQNSMYMICNGAIYVYVGYITTDPCVFSKMSFLGLN